MRANTYRVDSDDTSIDGFVRLLDHFAALPAGAPALRARRNNGRPQARRAVPDTPFTATMLARTRVGLAGLIVILLVGGFGFALWTGPQSCHGCDDALVVAPSAQASDSAATALRLQYTATANLGEILKQHPSQSAHDWSAPSKRAELGSAELPAQSASAAAQAEENIAPSLMTTSATGRLLHPQSLAETNLPQNNHGLSAVATEVSDTEPKPVKLAAATEISSEIKSPPSVLAIERTPTNEVAAIDIPIRKPKLSGMKRHHVQSQAPRKTARVRRKVKPTQSSAQIPPWARKMYEGNWQDRAFSYQYR